MSRGHYTVDIDQPSVGKTVTCAARDITPVTYKPMRVLVPMLNHQDGQLVLHAWLVKVYKS